MASFAMTPLLILPLFCTLALAAPVPGPFNVRAAPFNAAGDGIKNDRPALQAALDSAGKRGGSVYMPAGVYKVDAVWDKGNVRVYSLRVKSGTRLYGDGRGASIIRLADNQPNESRILTNDHYSQATGDSDITFEDFAIDGNAAHQADSCSFGIRLVYTRNVRHNRVRVQDVKGTVTFEGAGFESYFSSHNSYSDCEFMTTTAPEIRIGSGFSATGSTGIEYRGCRASGSTVWQGFTICESRLISYANCHAFLIAQKGFNSEISQDVQYVNCVSGGRSTSNSEGYPYPPGKSFRNVYGFYVWHSERVLIQNAVAIANHQGVSNVGSTDLRIVGGDFTGNDFALVIENAAGIRSTRVTGGAILKDSKQKAMSLAGDQYANAFGPVGPPALPPSDSVFYNPFPMDATVYLSGPPLKGIEIMGQDLGGYAGAMLRLPAGGWLRLRYAQPPTWKWVLE
jgi:hypothetical protein